MLDGLVDGSIARPKCRDIGPTSNHLSVLGSVMLCLTAMGHHTVGSALELAEAVLAETYPTLDPALVEAVGAHMGALREAMEGVNMGDH